jgi:uncharacterized RDD family membrane protein YckC
VATITCGACGFSREVDDQKLRPELLWVTCKKCGSKFVIDGAVLLQRDESSLKLDWGDRPPPLPGTAPGAVAPAGVYVAPPALEEAPPPDPAAAAPPDSLYAAGVVDRSMYVGSEPVTYAGPASFFSRTVAYILDGVIVSAVSSGVTMAFMTNIPESARQEILQAAQRGEPILAHAGKYWGVILIAQLMVFTLFTIMPLTLWGLTIGKAVLGIRVVTATGETPGLLRVILRETLGKGCSACIVYLGFLMAIWDDRNQALHDKIAGTFVVQK